MELPGLSEWVDSTPLEPDLGGGDVHYLSVWSKGRVSRVAAADVAGRGSHAGSIAEYLRNALQHHTHNWDQSALMRELNEAFARESQEGQANIRGAGAEVDRILRELWQQTIEGFEQFLRQDGVRITACSHSYQCWNGHA